MREREEVTDLKQTASGFSRLREKEGKKPWTNAKRQSQAGSVAEKNSIKGQTWRKGEKRTRSIKEHK